MEALKPILIIPLISSLVVGLAMIYLIGKPVAGILEGLTHWLQTMGTANAVLLGAILGGMMCTDMGGPGEQSGVCVRRRSVEYPDLRADGGDHGRRYGAAVSAGSGDDGGAS
ncbi:PTS system, fructose-specific IIBC component [Salmonella enterica subsp. arizonae]|uniref:PTS system, fructose-specific IIBC component n=1 Tax=Salmonella enterica subsp. arizonae TaxID=59203 RepID=A0A2X4W850_SALER|nr:PTS system, fructose-specific IIBC component [Salmonella enterica subsp. arizonae]